MPGFLSFPSVASHFFFFSAWLSLSSELVIPHSLSFFCIFPFLLETSQRKQSSHPKSETDKWEAISRALEQESGWLQERGPLCMENNSMHVLTRGSTMHGSRARVLTSWPWDVFFSPCPFCLSPLFFLLFCSPPLKDIKLRVVSMSRERERERERESWMVYFLYGQKRKWAGLSHARKSFSLLRASWSFLKAKLCLLCSYV